MLSQTILRCPCQVLLILRLQFLADAQAFSTFQLSQTGVPDRSPMESPPLPLHGATLPEIGHVFLSSGVNENI